MEKDAGLGQGRPEERGVEVEIRTKRARYGISNGSLLFVHQFSFLFFCFSYSGYFGCLNP